MLKVSFRNPDRAVAPRRHRTLFRGLLIAVLLLTLGAVLIEPQPRLRLPTAADRLVADHARQRLEARGAEEDAARLATLIAEAEAVTAVEAQEPFWRRDETTVLTAWDRALAHATLSLERLRKARQAGRQRWRDAEADARVALEEGRRDARAAGSNREAVRLLTQAEQELARAGRLATSGAYEAAEQAARQVLELTAELRDRRQERHARFADARSLALWRQQIKETIAHSARTGSHAVVVDKFHHRLHLYRAGRQILSLPVELGFRGLERKLHSGDRATPEGRYKVVEARGVGRTRYHKALLLDYPNSQDRSRYAAARRRGEIPRGASIGGLIEIHGHGGRGNDWTDGCVALTDRDMDRVFARAPVGTPVTIVGKVPDHVP